MSIKSSENTTVIVDEPGPGNSYQENHVAILRKSLRHWTGQDLVDLDIDGRDAAEFLYHAPFVLLSHDSSADPVFTYANRAGQRLFEMTWADFLKTPSRHSAEPVNREERERILREVASRGFIDQYQGVRISKTGRRFFISEAVVWNLLGMDGRLCGQAAMFDRWKSVDE